MVIVSLLHPCNINHANRVSNHGQFFNELNIQNFDFTNGFKCSDVHNFGKLNNLSINIFEFNFYQDHDKWRHKLTPIEVGNNESKRVIDLIIYKNQDAFIKKLNVFFGNHNKKLICRKCLCSYTRENMFLKHKPKCESNDNTTIRTSSESHLHWKKQFHKNPFYFRIYPDFESDNEIDNSSIGNKTTIIYKQNPILIGYHIESELNDNLKSGYYESPLGYNNVDWFVDETIKLENKMA